MLIIPELQYSKVACGRAFSSEGRMAALACQKWSEGYHFHPFRVVTTIHEFELSRRAQPVGSKSSNISAVYTPSIQEVLVQGILQGHRHPPCDSKAASALCNARMWQLVRKVIPEAQMPELWNEAGCGTYQGLKTSKNFKGRRLVKDTVEAEALKGWVRNELDDFELESL